MRTAPSSSPLPGARWDGTATTFSVTSRTAEAVELCLYDDGGAERREELAPSHDGGFTGRFEGVRPGATYGLRVHGPWDPRAGLRHNPNKLLIDPYTRSIEGELVAAPALYGHALDDPDRRSELDSAPHALRSVVTEDTFDWQGDTSPAVPPADAVIYETHVKGITMRHPAVPDSLRGTYAGLAVPDVVDHLVTLGVTSIELLPVQRFVQDPHLLETGRRNYWGYNTIGFFAPHAAYAAGADPVSEFKLMVRELHGAGLEVILDVVYNHTAEGNHLGPTLCFRGIDNPAWYRLTPEDPRLYDNWTGTGNTLNMASPEALTLVMDSLRYWVEEMHVDGFRFDLATVLGRTHMNFDPLGGFFGAAVQDPVLRDVKLIAEPWDVGPAGYRVSGFPARFAEWNDRYRDAVRDMWRGAGGVLGEFAHRITGSSDFYERAGRKPTAGVNFVTSHDGFTMADLVSYDVRRNHANGEDNADGHGDNRSWNSGTEGPTTDPGINRLRIDRTRAMLATLMLSQGIPMLLGGDEIRRSQGGNNNAYNQDNEISWYDWSRPDEELYGFVRSLIRLRREHPTFRRTMWLHEDVDSATDRVAWFTPVGEEMTVDDWHDPAARSVALHLPGDVIHASEGLVADDDFYLAINATERAESFSIPALLGPEPWIIEVDSADPPRAGQEVGGTFPVDRFSLLVVRRPWAPPGDRSPGIGVAGSG